LNLTAVLLLVLFALAWRKPPTLGRLVLTVLARICYRLIVLGESNIPSRGGAILVCNHVSRLDWLLLLAAQPRRIRFVLFGTRPTGWFWRRVWRWARVINIDDGSSRAVVKGLRRAAEAVERGELICLFAESQRTQTGLMLPFHREFEVVVRHCRAPVIPTRLELSWGSLFSNPRGRFFLDWPHLIPRPVIVAFGPPLPPDTPASVVRQTMQELSADSALATAHYRVPVHRSFVRQAARHPLRRCLFDGMTGISLNYGKTLAGVLCLARQLRPVLKDEPIVAVWLPQGVGGALANIVLAMLHKASVNLNYTSQDVVRSCIRQAGCRHVLTARRFLDRVPLDPGPGVELILLEDIGKHISNLQKAIAFLAVVLIPGVVLEWLLGLRAHTVDDLATIIFSSGSTGDPKGVMLTHDNIAANAESLIQAASVSPDDRLLGVLPFFHSFGYTVTLWAPLMVGASSVYYPDPRAAKEIGELCRTHCCTIYLSTATFLRFCLRKCGPDDFRSVRILVCGAEKLPQSLARDFEKRFGVLPLEGYGCTELSPVVSCNVPDFERDGTRQLGNKSGSIGQPLPGIAIRIVDPESMAPLPAGTEGLVLVRGANVMRGYLHRSDLTARAIRDGWYITGDIGFVDADGFATLTGRLSRFAKIGGEMVPLERLQEELHEVIDASDRVCAVTCVPDEARGERLIVLYLQEQLPNNGFDIRGWCRRLSARGLPMLWVPSHTDFHAVAELPVLGSGKLDLRRLKELALEIARR